MKSVIALLAFPGKLVRVMAMNKPLRLRVKRIYEPPSKDDGLRYLVDRIWPRGLKKEECQLDGWLKELAPSNALRKWYGHDVSRWKEFQERYARELDEQSEACHNLAKKAQDHTVTLLYGARDREHNQAVALKTYLEKLR